MDISTILFIVPTLGEHIGIDSMIQSVRRAMLNVEGATAHKILFVTENVMMKYKYYGFKDIEIEPCPIGTKFTEKINLGLRGVMNRGGLYKYVCFLNDDVYFSRGSIGKIIEQMKGDQDYILNPYSNCDRGWLHQRDTGFGIGLPIIKVDDEMEKKINEVKSPLVPECKDINILTPTQHHVAFFCTFLKASTIQKIGYLDERMKTVCSDFEYCNRLVNINPYAVIGWVPEAFVFHFGAVTRKYTETQNPIAHKEEDTVDSYTFSRIKKKILLYSGPSWEKWSVHNLYKDGIGGSETCLVYLARHLVQNGYLVDAIIDCESEHIADGVRYLPFKKYGNDFATFSYDVIISSRIPEIIHYIKCPKKIIWCHDIAFQNMDHIQSAGKFDNIVLLSDWHREFWKQFGFDDKVTVIPDGIELARFKEHASSSKTRFIYSSSWDRGLDNVIYILNEVRKRTNNNDIILDIYYGDYNLVRTYTDLKLTHLCMFHNRILSHQQWDWIKFHKRVNQNELADAMSTSFAWLYPTYFEETCCLTAMEAMASGLPIIHNAYAGLRRFIDTGIAIDTGKLPSVFMDDKCDKKVFEPFITATIELLRNPTLWRELSKQSLAKAQNYSWQRIVKEEWQKLIEG